MNTEEDPEYICERISAVVDRVNGHRSSSRVAWSNVMEGRSHAKTWQGEKENKQLIVHGENPNRQGNEGSEDEDGVDGEELSKFELAHVYEDLIKSEVEKAELREQLAASNMKALSAQADGEESRKVIDSLRKKVEAMNHRVSQLERSVELKDYEVKVARERLRDAENTRERNPEIHHSVMTENAKLREEVKEKEKIIYQLRLDIQTAKEREARVQALLDEEVEGRRKQQEENEMLSETISELQSQCQFVERVREELREARWKEEEMKQREDEKMANYHLVEEEKAKLKDLVESMRNQEIKTKSEAQDMVHRISFLEDRLIQQERARYDIHEELMELKGNIRVFVRLRPLLPDEKGGMAVHVLDFGLDNGRHREVECAEKSKYRGGLSETPRKWRFEYDRAFSQSSHQDVVYDEVRSFIQSAIDGSDVCIFAYGQTGSGKTYTMFGPDTNYNNLIDSNYEDRGIIFRSLEHIFESIRSLKSLRWKFTVSMEALEIYNEKIRDLLNPKGNENLELRLVSENGERAVSGLICKKVKDIESVFAILEDATSRRVTKSTKINRYSSRSHCILTLRIEGENEASGKKRSGVLHMIDLAGSERLSQSGSADDPELLREAQCINKSLSALGNVIAAIANKERYVPFRDTKLTSVLQQSLGNGNCKALMFCNISPGEKSLNESLCSLRFAKKVNNSSIRFAEKDGRRCPQCGFK